MLDHVNLGAVLFLDIETVSEKPTYEELDDRFKKLWKLKCRGILKKYDEEINEEEAAAAYIDRAGIFAEFGKIICISVGFLVKGTTKGEWNIRLKSFADRDEKVLLKEFTNLVEQYYDNTARTFFCGHNINEFDMPYICRRLLINQLPLPNSLQIAGKKPWELKHFLDTLVLWKFGDYKNYTSLNLLAAVFGFPTPKDDIDGSQVGRVFWEEDDLERIAIYCEKDVLAVIHLLMKYKRMELIPEERTVSVSEFAVKQEN